MNATRQTLMPGSAQAVAEALGAANAQRTSVRVRGAGTKDYLGELAPTELVLETAALRGVVAHVPADLTITVAAGTPFREVRDALAREGQFLPLDPPHAEAATIGGIVAANSTGFWRARYGGVRDVLIGTTTALADGTLARAGGRVVKNVAGYDLGKLLIGSLGTLGVITECTFKVLPLPATAAGLAVSFRVAAEAFAAAHAVANTSARPAALVIERTGRDPMRFVVVARGDAAAVQRTLAIARDAARGNGAGTTIGVDPDDALEQLRELPATARGLLVRASLPVAAQAAFADIATRLDGFAQLVADAASGIVRVHVKADDDDEIAAADELLAGARVCGGSARVERRPESLRERVAAWGDGDAPGLFLMRRIKSEFDPNGILEPGRGIVG
jgi:glycolate oxidase FAD binding subunit